jgi:hypothetical protein
MPIGDCRAPIDRLTIDERRSTDCRRQIESNHQPAIGVKSTMTIHHSNRQSTIRRSAIVNRHSVDRRPAVGNRQ